MKLGAHSIPSTTVTVVPCRQNPRYSKVGFGVKTNNATDTPKGDEMGVLVTQ